MNKSKRKKAIKEGMITFNPFTLDMSTKRYDVVFIPMYYPQIVSNDISDLVLDAMIDCKEHSEFKKNLYVDIYGLGSYAEVTWIVSFDSIKEVKEYMKKQNLTKLVAETSCPQTQNLFEKMLPEKKIKDDYCYFAPRGIFHKLKHKKIIITPLSSDIFLR